MVRPMHKRISDDQNAIARRIFHEGRPYGVVGTATISPRRTHWGYGDDAWSKPKLVIYGVVTDRAAVLGLAHGWDGEIAFAENGHG